jgi:hypothetical protein
VTVSNSLRNYTFSGGTIAGTSSLLKQGPGTLTINLVKQGPVTVSAGTLNGGGTIGLTTLASNAVLNYSGTVNGGLTSTGTVSMAGGSVISGGVTIRGGTFVNSGTVSTTPGTMIITGNAQLTNTASGILNVFVPSGNNWDLTAGSTLANFGTINNVNQRFNFEGTVFGTGTILDPDSGSMAGWRSTRAASCRQATRPPTRSAP